jgi:Polyketide cyclase / dehydrase and lipid transport
MKFVLGSNKPVSGQASVFIASDLEDVFSFVAENFFINYPKWAPDVVELQILDGSNVDRGVKGRQVRKDNDSLTESVFEITDFLPNTLFRLKGLDTPYLQSYEIEVQNIDGETKLTFRFDLLEIEIIMRPFEKLIRAAIEDGAETAVENIKNLLETSTTSAR